MTFINLPIDRVAATGAGVGRFEGTRVFAPGALPGDIIAFDFVAPERGRASVVAEHFDFVTRGAKRNPEACPHALSNPACGGCPLAALAYVAQIEAKKALLTDAIAQANKAEWLALVTEPERLVAQTGFRNKAFFVAHRDADFGVLRFGMYRAGSHEPARVAQCRQLVLWMNEAKAAVERILNEYWAEEAENLVYDEATQKGRVRGLLLRGGAKGERLMALVLANTDEAERRALAKVLETETSRLKLTSIYLAAHDAPDNRILGESLTLVAGKPTIAMPLMGLTFEVGPQTFMQVNDLQTPKLYALALAAADIGNEDVVWDLYCGVGTLTLLAAQKAKCAVGVEIVKESVAAARVNAQANGVANVDFVAGAVEAVLQSEALPSPDVVILDPAFKGLAATVPAALAASKARRLVYVSCNPKTLVRDLVQLTDLGFEVKSLTPVDLFPGALHVEVVATLERAQ